MPTNTHVSFLLASKAIRIYFHRNVKVNRLMRFSGRIWVGANLHFPIHLFFIALALLFSISNARSDEVSFATVEDPELRPRAEVEVVFAEDDNEYQAKSVKVGEQKTGAITNYTLWLKNETTKPMRIVGVKAQCGCTKILSTPKPIEVGHSESMVVSVEPIKPYFPAPQYRIELVVEGRLTPIVILLMSNISDAVAISGPNEALFRIAPTWAADAKEEIVNFDIELILGGNVNPGNLEVRASEELSFMKLKLAQVRGKTHIHGSCSSSDVPPDTTAGLISVLNRTSAGDGKSTSESKLEMPIRVINPPPITFLPSPFKVEKEQKSGRWIGKGLVRVDPVLIKSTEDEPAFTLKSPDRGTLRSKKLGKLLYSVEVQLLEDEKDHKVAPGIEIGAVVSGKEFILKAKVE